MDISKLSKGSPIIGLRVPRTSPYVKILLGLTVLCIPLLFAQHHATSPSPYVPSLSFFSSAPYPNVPPPTGGIPGLPYDLTARLDDLLSRPILSFDDAQLQNRHGCPQFTFSRHNYFFHHDGRKAFWEGTTVEDIQEYRDKIIEYFNNVTSSGEKAVWDSSMEKDVPKSQRRGIIMAGGQGKSMETLRLIFHMLRNVHQSTLPIELYSYDGEIEDPEVYRELEEVWNVTPVSAGPKPGNGKNWNIKNQSFLKSKFTEFIWLDSDNIPLRDPASLFDSVEYKQSGSVFWSDLNKDHPDNSIFRILGRYCSDQHWPAETGQMIFDKRANNGLNYAVLQLSNWMMTSGSKYGNLSYGDKDTFRFASYALGLDYQMATKLFASAGGYQDARGGDSDKFCGHSMIQWGLTPSWAARDPSYHPEPFFLHTVLAKHKHHLQPSKLFSHVLKPRLDGINEPTLVRTLYEFTGQCFAITLKGPDGLPESPGGLDDGQGVLMLEMRDVVGEKVWEALEEISPKYVDP